MLDERIIRNIFYDALQLHRVEYCVNDDQIIKAIISIQDGYAAKKVNSSRASQPLNYDQPAYRCGYLHKYAACHASLVQHVVNSIGADVLGNLFEYLSGVNICCIGGGPGTDVIGLCAILYTMPGLFYKSIHFDVVDCMLEWRKAFASVLQASLSCGSFGAFLTQATCSYHFADMLAYIPGPVKNSIGNADLLTMIKFVSAASSSATPAMLQAVFTMMKPGAAVLFVDNAGGGFYQLVSKTATRCGLVNLWGPSRHLKYQNQVFKRQMFGFFSLSSTTVAVQMWQKACHITFNGWQNHMTSSRFLGSYTAANCYGNSYSPNPTNVLDNQVVKKNIPERKSGSSVVSSVCDANKKSDKSSYKIEKSTSPSTSNAKPKMTCSAKNNSSHLPALKNSGSSAVQSVQQTLRKQGTSQFSGHTSGAVEPAGKFPASGTVQNQNLPYRSDPKGINIHCDSRGIESDGFTCNSARSPRQHLSSSSGSETRRSNRDEQTIKCCNFL